MHFQIVIHSPHDLSAAAKAILKSCAGKKVFAFLGEMGSGKTTLIKAMCNELGANEMAVSPTFAIVNEYSGREKIFHLDLFRLRNLQEAVDIGIEEYLASGNYCFIEWAEVIEKILPEESVTLTITVGKDEERIIKIQ